jgi:hypothetical protein
MPVSPVAMHIWWLVEYLWGSLEPSLAIKSHAHAGAGAQLAGELWAAAAGAYMITHGAALTEMLRSGCCAHSVDMLP